VSEAARPLRIRNAAELFSAMAHPQSAVRNAVISHIGQQPLQALAFGAHQGRDVVDALIEADRVSKDREESIAILWAMQSLPDGRLACHCAERMLHCTDDRQSVLLYRYLATHEVPWPRNVLQPLLWETARLTNAELAARLLVGTDCEDAVRVRICAILGRDGVTLPDFDPADMQLWLGELQGLWADNAREYLSTSGREAYTSLAAHWWSLDDTTQRWLLRWGVTRNFPDRTVLIEQALQDQCDAVILEALQDIAAIRDAGDVLKTPFELFLFHDSAAIRAAAIRAGACPGDWDALLEAETDPGVRGACMASLGRNLGSMAIPYLIDGLAHEDWMVVAAATEAIVTLGDAALAAVRPLVQHPSLQVRVAASRILCSSQNPAESGIS
jgi:hypothetical protein